MPLEDGAATTLLPYFETYWGITLGFGVISGFYWVVEGVYRDNGQENGSYHLGFRVESDAYMQAGAWGYYTSN